MLALTDVRARASGPSCLKRQSRVAQAPGCICADTGKRTAFVTEGAKAWGGQWVWEGRRVRCMWEGRRRVRRGAARGVSRSACMSRGAAVLAAPTSTLEEDAAAPSACTPTPRAPLDAKREYERRNQIDITLL